MATNAKVTRGLLAVLLGTIANDGDVATSFPTQLGYIERGSANATQADDDVTEVYAEEVDNAIDVSYTEGLTTFTCRLINPDVDSLLLVFGGTITGTTPNRVWNSPPTRITIEKSLRITPKQGMSTTYPRVSLSAKFDYVIGKAGTMGVIVTGRVLQPEKAGVSAKMVGNPVVV